MARKLFPIMLVLLLVSVSFSATLAQDFPRGGTVVVNESPRGSWVRNFNPFAPDPMHGTRQIIYEPLASLTL
jgi:hypothetical protein